MIGFKKPANDLLQLLTNRHLALENYQFESIRVIKDNEKLANALTDVKNDNKYPPFDLNYPRHAIAAEAHRRANPINELLIEVMPKLYVNDPAYIFTGTDPTINLRDAIKNNLSGFKKFDAEFLTLMRACGSHSRITTDYLLNQKPAHASMPRRL